MQTNEKSLNFDLVDSPYSVYSSHEMVNWEKSVDPSEVFNKDNLNTDERKLYDDLQVLENTISDVVANPRKDMNDPEFYDKIKVGMIRF